MPTEGGGDAKGGKTETKAEALPKEIMHDGDKGKADEWCDVGEGDADGRRVRRRRRCQRWACATETKAETPMEA